MYLAYPEIGAKLKCPVIKASFTQAVLKVLEVDGQVAVVDYKAVLKGNSVGEEIYVCDSLKNGDLIDCTVISCGDNYITVAN